MGSSKKPRIAVTIVGVAIMMAAIAIVLFSGASGITRQNIEEHLARFNTFITEKSVANNREAKFTAGDILIEGWGFNKTGLIQNITLEIAQKTLIDTNKWSFSTSKIQVLPDPINPKRLYFTFPDTIHAIKNSELITNIDFTHPLKYGFFDGYDGEHHTLLHTLHFPEQIVLSAPNSAHSKSTKTVVTYKGTPVLQTRILPNENSYQTDYAFDDIKITGDEGEITISSVVGRHEESKEGQKRLGKYELNIADIIFKNEQNPQPYSISADIDYTVDQSQDGSTAQNMQIAVNKIALMSSDFKINSQGNIAAEIDDPLPAGILNVEIENPGKFVQSELVPVGLKDWVNEALQRATGAPVESDGVAKFALKRDKNGVFYVGITTFEALTASLLTHILQIPGPAGKIVLPPEGAIEPEITPPTYNNEPVPETVEPTQ